MKQLYCDSLGDDLADVCADEAQSIEAFLASCSVDGGYSSTSAETEPWGEEDTFVCIPGPWRAPCCFYVDALRGSCYRVDDTLDYLTADDLVTFEADVRAADEKELSAFVKHKIFEPQPLHRARKRPCQRIWVRRWNWSTGMVQGRQVRKRIIKSRLCVRGYLDPQKWQLSRHSSTATRLSQKILVPDCAVYGDWNMESLDVSNAFLWVLASICSRVCAKLWVSVCPRPLAKCTWPFQGTCGSS